MSHQGNIYWLASYPKSGNTWVRAFISNLMRESSEPVDINALCTGPIASSREWINKALDFDINELSHDEIDQLRPEAYCWLSEQMNNPSYVKVHDGYTFLPKGRPLISQKASRGTLYIIRNPLDVAVSFAHHCDLSIDQTISNMADPQYCFADGTHKIYPQLRQKLLTWSEHVTSWLDRHTPPLLLVRYEDMKLNPLATFTKIARFLELPCEETAIENALTHCEIKNLQAQEQTKTFNEKPPRAKNFFRKGVVGDWQTALNEGQIRKIIFSHGKVMQRFGYIDEQNQPIIPFDYISARDKEALC